MTPTRAQFINLECDPNNYVLEKHTAAHNSYTAKPFYTRLKNIKNVKV